MSLTPHCCPVCLGRGRVPPGFYELGGSLGTIVVSDPCRSCAGTGVVWSRDTVVVNLIVRPGDGDGLACPSVN